MKTLRKIHLLLGCLFAPLLLYYCLTGAWQTLGWHETKVDGEKTPTAQVLHDWSEPHEYKTFPGANKKTDSSEWYGYTAVAMALGISFTLILGIVMAFNFFRPRWVVALCLVGGITVPLLLLWMAIE
jgi:hypothetical protein